jgi:radical SAM superfamily enzyme YgiQ (UPF0313 family)
MPDILLSTINAKYIHASLGLRYLYANMGALQSSTAMQEFTLEVRAIDIVESLLNEEPKIIGFGVYIWNVELTSHVVMLLKAIAPEIQVIVGGPEVSYEWESQDWLKQVNYILPGQADKSFPELCQAILDGKAPLTRVVQPTPFKLSELTFPYSVLTDEDIKNRIIYVEASRGCPFKCEFCLSSLDKTATPFSLDDFLEQMECLYQRGTRHFKFVDRTFNLKAKTGIAILSFFLERLDDDLFLHFEIIPDHLPEALKEWIARFPPGHLQFEIGIQSFNPQVQETISRKQHHQRTIENINWLRQNSQAHLHTDLIVGLPGETLESFAQGFDQLVALNPHEIQVGILKRLKGTPLVAHTENYEMVYNPLPPYNILSNSTLSFSQLQMLNRFARYWDMIGNSGRFSHSRPLILGDTPYERFSRLSDWLYAMTDQTHRIALKRLFELLYEGMTTVLAIDTTTAAASLWQDYQASGLKGWPSYISAEQGSRTHQSAKASSSQARQARHIAS